MKVMIRECLECRELIGCYLIPKEGMAIVEGECRWCPECIVCVTHLDNIEKSSGLCQRHLQEAMDKLRERREREQTSQKAKKQGRNKRRM